MRVEELTGRVLVDTNVLIYATLAADPRHEQAQLVLAQRLRPEVELFISVQNLAEMYPNLTRLRGLITLPLTVETTHLTLDLCVEGSVTRQDYFNRQLAALMIRESIPIILTANTSDFVGIANITPINPFE